VNRPRLVSVNVGRPTTHTWGGKVERTAIVKAPVTDLVDVGWDGLAGDGRASPAHAGPYHAVYAYAAEDYAAWSVTLGRDLPPGMFGENLTVAGVDLSGALLGDRWRVGTSVLEVCGPRIPCQTFARRIGEPHWVRRFTEYGATGCYLRVIEVGVLQAADDVEVEPVAEARNPAGVSVLTSFRALTTERGSLPLLADVDALPPEVRAEAVARAADEAGSRPSA
jgi:MOSC domain-containing protein YiiM